MSELRIGALVVALALLATSVAAAQEACAVAITQQAYDRVNATEQGNIAFAKRDELCLKDYSSIVEAQAAARSAGFNIGFASLSIGGSGAKTNSAGRTEIRETNFCRASAEDFQSAFSLDYSSQIASIAVAAWLDCVKSTAAKNQLYIDYAVIPTGQAFIGTLHKTVASGPLAATIDGITVVGGANEISCNIGGSIYTPTTILKTPAKITTAATTIACERKGKDHATIAFQTSDGGLPPIALPSEIELEVGEYELLKARLDQLTKDLSLSQERAGARILASGSSKSEGSIIEWPVSLEKPALLIVAGYTQNQRIAPGATANAGVYTDIFVNGSPCSRDLSFEAISQTITFFSSASCVVLLPAGENIVRAKRTDHPGSTPGNRLIRADWVVLKLQDEADPAG